jgi:hypothetical protein
MRIRLFALLFPTTLNPLENGADLIKMILVIGRVSRESPISDLGLRMSDVAGWQGCRVAGLQGAKVACPA